MIYMRRIILRLKYFLNKFKHKRKITPFIYEDDG